MANVSQNFKSRNNGATTRMDADAATAVAPTSVMDMPVAPARAASSSAATTKPSPQEVAAQYYSNPAPSGGNPFAGFFGGIGAAYGAFQRAGGAGSRVLGRRYAAQVPGLVRVISLVAGLFFWYLSGMINNAQLPQDYSFEIRWGIIIAFSVMELLFWYTNGFFKVICLAVVVASIGFTMYSIHGPGEWQLLPLWPPHKTWLDVLMGIFFSAAPEPMIRIGISGRL